MAKPAFDPLARAGDVLGERMALAMRLARALRAMLDTAPGHPAFREVLAEAEDAAEEAARVRLLDPSG